MLRGVSKLRIAGVRGGFQSKWWFSARSGMEACPGKLADFFLVPGDPTTELKAIKTISMVVKDGTFYYPSEVYPKFGIEPFTSAPTIKQAVESR
jgi:hypothetical protein